MHFFNLFFNVGKWLSLLPIQSVPGSQARRSSLSFSVHHGRGTVEAFSALLLKAKWCSLIRGFDVG